jgi:uncharacterized membrane protein (DUF4010 family)
MDQHPNAAAAGVSGAVAVIAVAVIGAFVAMSPVVAAAASSLVIAAVLFVGRKGLKGVKDRIWSGE